MMACGVRMGSAPMLLKGGSCSSTDCSQSESIKSGRLTDLILANLPADDKDLDELKDSGATDDGSSAGGAELKYVLVFAPLLVEATASAPSPPPGISSGLRWNVAEVAVAVIGSYGERRGGAGGTA